MKTPRFLSLMLSGLLWAGLATAQININTATSDELDSLKGIGPGKAQAIVDYRNKHGQFRSVEELQNVPGIGPGTLKKIRRDVMVTGASPAPTNVLVAIPVATAQPVPAKPKTLALPPPGMAPDEAPRPASPVARPASGSMPAGPARPAGPAVPGKASPAVPSAAQPTPAPTMPAPARPAAPAMPGKPAAPAAAADAAPVHVPAPPATPSAPAKPAMPARPAMVN